MRWLVLLAVVGCKEPVAPPAVSAHCPVGDGTNVAVYSFLERAVEDARPYDDGRAGTRKALAAEAEALASKGQLKPPRSSIIESETSHILSTLCEGADGCVAIGVYNANGLAIALSSQTTVAPLGFGDDARWKALLAAAREEGGTAELTCDEAKAAELSCGGRKRYLLYPVQAGGVALCIVEH